MSTFLKIKEIGTSKYEFVQFAACFLFFTSKNEAEKQVYVSIKCELYLIDGF